MNKLSILAIALLLSTSSLAQRKPEHQMDKTSLCYILCLLIGFCSGNKE